MTPYRAIPLLAVVCALIGAAPAQAANLLSLNGGATDDLTICGVTHDNATQANVGQKVSAVVRRAASARGRASRKGARLIVDRCNGGKFTRVSSTAIPSTKSLRSGLTTSREATGDYRVRIRLRSGKTGRAGYFRVGAGEIVDTPVTFKVRNQDRTVPCLMSVDNRDYDVKGTLVGPRAAIDSHKAATLYLHGLGYTGSLFYRFQAVPGYDYGAEMAKDGHVSVVIDRLGYGDSTGPDGNATCFSSQADVTDQVIREIRSGGYQTGEGQGSRFGRVALMGHSAGGLIAEMTQYSFKSADALGVLGYTDRFASLLAISTLNASYGSCLQGGEPQDAGGPAHYDYFGHTDADFQNGHLYNVDPAVAAAATSMRVRDPCGDLISGYPSFLANEPLVNTITVPVLLIVGSHDALFSAPGPDLQQITGFTASKELTRIDMPNSGHALTLSREAGSFRAKVGAWLTNRGF